MSDDTENDGVNRNVRTAIEILEGVRQDDSDLAMIERAFVYHPPQEAKRDGLTQVERYQGIRSEAHDLAVTILDSVPPSYERSLAFRALREAVMWANAGIAVNERGGS